MKLFTAQRLLSGRSGDRFGRAHTKLGRKHTEAQGSAQVKWKIATASVVTVAILSAPVAGAAPSDSGANNVAGQVIGQVTGTDPALIVNALTGLQGLLSKLGFGKARGNGNGAALQKATLDNVGKTLKKP